MQEFLPLVSEFGFPVACVIALAMFVFRIYKQSVERENRLYTELEESQKVNAQAISTIATYAAKLDVIQADVKEIKTDVTTLMANN